MPRAFNDEERKRIRARLIEAGKRLINRVGAKGITVDEAAQAAGISKGSFYSFFPSREDFILSVFESWEEQYRSALFREVLEGSGTARQRLERFFLGALEILEREPGLAHLGSGEIERIREGLPPERLAAHQAADSRAFGAAFASWVERGLVEPTSLAALPGLGAVLFAVAMHKEDFPAGSFEPAVRILAEALAMKIAPSGKGDIA
jgi:AcrR family transcriptional regulator